MKFFSRGKLLISGEYLVLKGAVALAVPLKFGQILQVGKSEKAEELRWESREYGKTWFSTTLKLPSLDIAESSDFAIAENLVKHLKAIIRLRPEFIEKMSATTVITDLEFKKEWGFGSSSGLISNLAYWADLDPFELHNKVSSGSGYDVICAREEGPVYFNVSKQGYNTEKLNLRNSVRNRIFFVYLGKKEDTAKNVDAFLAKKKSFRVEKRFVSELSRHMGDATNIEDFEYYMKEHEQIISSLLRKPPLKEGIFKDLAGEAKSLGAWGGDFAMITWNDTSKELMEYLSVKNMKTMFSFSELIKTR